MKKYIFHSGNRDKLLVERRAHPETVLLLRSPRALEVFLVLLLVVKGWVLAYKYLEAPEEEKDSWKRRAIKIHQKAHKAMRKAESRIDWNGRISWSKAVLWLCRDTLDNLFATMNPMIERVSPSYAEWVQLRKPADPLAQQYKAAGFSLKPERTMIVDPLVRQYEAAGFKETDAEVIPVGSTSQAGQGGSERRSTRDGTAGSSQG